MAKQSKLLLKGKEQWSLLYRLLFFSGFLILFSIKASLLTALFYLLAGAFSYFTLPRDREELKISYFFITVLSLSAVWLINFIPLPSEVTISIKLIFIITASAVYWFLLKLISFKTDKREFVYTFLNTFVFILLFIAVFSFIKPFDLGLAGIALFISLFLVLSEIFEFYSLSRRGLSLISDRRVLSINLTFSLIGVEIAWFTAVLPLGVLNSAILMALVFIILKDFIIAHFQGRLTSPFIFRQLTFLVLFTIIVFAVSNWSI